MDIWNQSSGCIGKARQIRCVSRMCARSRLTPTGCDLVDEGDVEAMAEAMIKVGLDYSEAVRFGEAGAARIRKVFGYDQTMGKLAEVIRSTWVWPAIEKQPAGAWHGCPAAGQAP